MTEPATSNDEHSHSSSDEMPTPLQLAIRQRAIDTAQHAEAQKKQPRSRWLFGAGLMVCMVLLFLFTLDVSVRVMHTIIDILIPKPSPPAAVDPKQPYFISVDPGQGGSAGSTSSESNRPPSK